MIFVHQLMSPDPFCLPETMSASEAVKRLIANRIHGAPVLDGTGRISGVASLVDLVDVRPVGIDGSTTTLADAMTHPPITVDPGATLHEAAILLVQSGIHRLVVVNDERRPIGVLTATDILRGGVNLGDAFRFGETQSDRAGSDR